MRCFCCGKELKVTNGILWHKTCIKSFFGVNTIPDIIIDKDTIKEIINDSVKNGVTVPGVQKKLSINLLFASNGIKMTIENHQSFYIFKPQDERLPFLPESEQLLMNMAEVIKIPTVPHALIKYGNDLGYITKRIDRINNNGIVKKIAMEDFCQLTNRLTEDKYKSSYEKCAEVIKKYSSIYKLDLADFFIRIVFSFITGNNDMHLKNFSLIYDEKLNGYRLSPQYDLVPAAIFINDLDELALTINGKNRHLTKNDFIKFGERCELNKKQVIKIIDSIIKKKDVFFNLIDDSYLRYNLKDKLKDLINKRIEIFK